jgi:glycosyltransferase involved in cell wall biosynthesis
MVVGIMRVKDEGDLIDRTAPLLAGQTDHVIVADNASTDGTQDVLAALATWPDFTVEPDDEVAYYQSEAMSRLAEQARQMDAGWVVPADADEVWAPVGGGHVRDLLAALPEHAHLCAATVYDYVAHPGETFSSWRQPEPLPLPKVACRAVEGLVIHQGNHGATLPGIEHPLAAAGLRVAHFPYRTPEQFIRKVRNGAAAYAATTLDPSVGAHWRQYGELTDDQLREVFHEHFHSTDPERDGLVYDPCPLSGSSPGAQAASTAPAP